MHGKRWGDKAEEVGNGKIHNNKSVWPTECAGDKAKAKRSFHFAFHQNPIRRIAFRWNRQRHMRAFALGGRGGERESVSISRIPIHANVCCVCVHCSAQHTFRFIFSASRRLFSLSKFIFTFNVRSHETLHRRAHMHTHYTYTCEFLLNAAGDNVRVVCLRIREYKHSRPVGWSIGWCVCVCMQRKGNETR